MADYNYYLTRTDWDRLMEFIGPDGKFKSKYRGNIETGEVSIGYLYEFAEFSYLRPDLNFINKLRIITQMEKEIKLNLDKNSIFTEIPCFVPTIWSRLLLSLN